MNGRTTASAVLLWIASCPLAAQSCVSSLYSSNSASSISIVSSDPHVSSGSVAGGVGKWQSCSQAGSGFPALLSNTGGGDITFGVANVPGVSTSATGGCAQFRPSLNGSGQVVGGTIELFDATTNGYDCEPDREELIAHEIGHGLGLNDSPCSGYMMGPPYIGGGLSVQPDECSGVDGRWTTPAEQSGNGGDDQFAMCGSDPNGCAEPILISFRGPYRLSGLEDPVIFDINASGHAQTIGWTARDSDLVFLAVDRNGNGYIDDGSELFGNATPLIGGGRAANGFAGLAQYDANGDGVIDASDSVWSDLLLWNDRNHNGISEPTELQQIAESPVTSIDLEYHRTERRDQSGNRFGYEGHLREGRRVRPFYDVFFVLSR